MNTGQTPKAMHHPGTFFHRLGWLAFVALACAHFAILDLWKNPQFLNLSSYAAGTERLPYQGRILMAWILNLTAGNHRLAPVLAYAATHAPPEFRDPYIFALLIAKAIAMFVAVVAARASLLHLSGDRRFASWLALLTIYMAYFNLVDVYGLTYSLPYDVPSLALFSIAVWLILTNRYWLLLPVFALGTLNRETFCFVTIFLALYTWNTPSERSQRPAAIMRVAPHLVLQTILWVAIRAWLHHKFLHNPHDPGATNGLFDLHLFQNVRSALKPAQWPLFLSLFGFTLPLFVASYRWIGNRALARSVAAFLIIWAGAMMVVGVIVEIRIFNELTGFLVPTIGLIVWNRWVRPAANASPPQPL